MPCNSKPGAVPGVQPKASSVKDGKVMLNGAATVVASVPASNGIVHVVDAVVLQPAK